MVVLIVRAILPGLCIGAPDFWKLLYDEKATIERNLPAFI